MNSERRHELQQNVLAEYLGEWLKKVEPYAKHLVIVFAAIVVVVIALGLFQNSASMARSDATLELLQNANGGDPEALASVGDRYPKTTAGSIARLFEADTNLGAGLMALYNDREDGEAKIDDAAKSYREVATSTKDKLLSSRAYFGLGHALESLGKVDEAISAYGQAITFSDSDAVVSAAQQRIDLLKKPETQEFLAWFAKQEFKPTDPSLPPSLPSGTSLPGLPDLELPPITPLQVPSELKSDAGAETKPAPGDITLPALDVAPAAEPTMESKPEPTSEPKLELPPTEAQPVAPVDKPADSAATPTPEKPKLDNPTVDVTDATE